MADIRDVTDDGDWVFGKGTQNYGTTDRAIMTDIATKLKLYQGEVFWDTEAGVPWFSLLGQKSTDPLVYAIRKVILGVSGVMGVKALTVTLDSERRALIQYSVDTVYTTGVRGRVTV